MFAISLQFRKKNVKDEVDFLPAYKRQRFLQCDTVILEENMKNEVDFLRAYKHQRFLQSDTIILGACDQVCGN